MPISFENKIIFIHIPKNAGTSITKQLNMQDVGHHFPDYYMTTYPNEWQTFKKMAIVRNPWDRVVSCYEHAKMENSFWHTKTGITGFGTANGIHPDHELLRNASFRECIHLLKDRMLKHQGWGTQHSYTHINNLCVLDEINKFEKISKNLIKVNNSDRKDYKAYYDSEELVNIVRNIYEADINFFDYTYD